MKFLILILSGLLAGLSYPARFGDWLLPDLGFLAFFAWVPLFQLLINKTPRQVFRLSFLAGAVHYLVSQYWLYTAMNTFGGLEPAISGFGLVLLVGLLAFFFAFSMWLSQWIHQKTKLPLLVVRPMIWLSMEYFRTHFPLEGFPWSQPGYSQGGFITFSQSADLFGVYITSYLVMLSNETISLIFSRLRHSSQTLPKTSLAWLILPLLLWTLNLGYGYYRLEQLNPKAKHSIKVGMIQGNIPQSAKWDIHQALGILKTYIQGTQNLEGKGADLIVWPEASLPYAVAYDGEKFKAHFRTKQADLLLGAITYSQRDKRRLEERSVYNSTLLVNPEGELLDYYHKKHLVPFGEYIPYKDYLPFAQRLTQVVGDLQAGAEYRPLQYQTQSGVSASLGILICYEDIFPEIARQMVQNGAQVLVNLTNDAWYGYSGAAYQHQVFSQFRSIETRRALLRVTNTGISSLIDRTGEIKWQGEFFEYQEKLTELPIYNGEKSWYVKWGDLLPKTISSLGLIFIIITLIIKTRQKNDQVLTNALILK